MRPLELTTRGVIGTLAVFVVAGVCIRLGVWQLDRRAARLAHNEALAERMAADPVTLHGVPRDTAGLTFRRARLAGPVDDDRAVILAGRSLNDAPGIHLLSPVRVGDGAVLVNRGWLPSPDAATLELDAFRVEGALRAEGVLVPFPEVELDPRPGVFRVQWFRVDGAALRGQYPYAVAPLYLVATARPERTGAAPAAGPPTAAGTPRGPRPLDPPAQDPGPHLSYAIQWFSFAAIFLGGWVVLLLQRGRDRRRDDGPDGEPAGPDGGADPAGPRAG